MVQMVYILTRFYPYQSIVHIDRMLMYKDSHDVFLKFLTVSSQNVNQFYIVWTFYKGLLQTNLLKKHQHPAGAFFICVFFCLETYKI